MKPLPVAFAVIALCAFGSGFAPGEAAETEPSTEAPAITPLGPALQDESAGTGRGELSCTLEDQKSAEIHTLTCRFENSESCVLRNPTPLQVLMRRYDRVKFLMIGATPEGCSTFTFSGSLKTK